VYEAIRQRVPTTAGERVIYRDTLAVQQLIAEGTIGSIGRAVWG
jgi:hypothetical protein